MSKKGTSTQQTEFDPAGPGELELLNLVNEVFIPAYMEEAGYEVTTTKIDSFKDSEMGKELYAEHNKWRDRVAKIREVTANNPSAWNADKEGYTYNDALDKLNKVDDKIKEQEENFVPYSDYETRKREAPEVEQAMAAAEKAKAKYGEDSAEYKKAKKKYSGIKKEYEGKEIAADVQKREIQTSFMNNVQKYLDGDFSVTPEQEKLIQDQMAPIKATLEYMYSDNPEETLQKYKEFADQIPKGINVMDAIKKIGEQVQETGADMTTALESTIKAHGELLKMGVEDATLEISKNVSMNAIRTGRDPTDPEYQKQIQEGVAREVSRGQLSLAEMESRGKMGIAERTGAGMEDVARMTAAAKKEGGMGAVRLQESSTELRKNIGIGLPPSQISVGSGFSTLDQALAQQRLANAGASGPIGGQLGGYYQPLRMGQATVTQSTSPGVFDYVTGGLGLVGAGANIYSGVTSANALRDMANQYGGGWT